MLKRSVINAPQPAAGQGVTIPSPESEIQWLIGVAFRIVTSAIVATRGPFVRVTDGSGVQILTACAGQGVTASSTADYCFAYGLTEWDVAGVAAASGPLARFPLGEGDSIVVGVDTIDAGDQLSNVRIIVEQMPLRP